jgi:hypothetical protein
MLPEPFYSLRIIIIILGGIILTLVFTFSSYNKNGIIWLIIGAILILMGVISQDFYQ